MRCAAGKVNIKRDRRKEEKIHRFHLHYPLREPLQNNGKRNPGVSYRSPGYFFPSSFPDFFVGFLRTVFFLLLLLLL